MYELDDGALGALSLLVHECRPCGVLEDLSHSLASLGTAFEVLNCSNLFLSTLTLLCIEDASAERWVSLYRGHSRNSRHLQALAW